MSLINNSFKRVIIWGRTCELVLEAGHPGISMLVNVFHTYFGKVRYCSTR